MLALGKPSSGGVIGSSPAWANSKKKNLTQKKKLICFEILFSYKSLKPKVYLDSSRTS